MKISFVKCNGLIKNKIAKNAPDSSLSSSPHGVSFCIFEIQKLRLYTEEDKKNKLHFA